MSLEFYTASGLVRADRLNTVVWALYCDGFFMTNFKGTPSSAICEAIVNAYRRGKGTINGLEE